MKLAIMQPYFFPYIGYWQLINSVDKFVIYDDVNFIKKGYINRNSILVKNMSHQITLNLKQSSQNKKINQIIVGDNQEKLLSTIKHSYNKSPFFDNVFPLLEKILHNKENNLSIFLGDSLKAISNYLGLNTEFIYSKDIKKDNELTGQEKIINICNKLDCHTYINAIGGKSLYSKEEFNKNKIQLCFIEPKINSYKQFGDNFTPNLSIIDMLMFISVNEINQTMLPSFELT